MSHLAQVVVVGSFGCKLGLGPFLFSFSASFDVAHSIILCHLLMLLEQTRPDIVFCMALCFLCVFFLLGVNSTYKARPWCLCRQRSSATTTPQTHCRPNSVGEKCQSSQTRTPRDSVRNISKQALESFSRGSKFERNPASLPELSQCLIVSHSRAAGDDSRNACISFIWYQAGSRVAMPPWDILGLYVTFHFLDFCAVTNLPPSCQEH